MKSRTVIAISSLFFLITLNSLAQSPEFYPLEDIKPGQKGYGKTVFEGTKTEKFGVEVLGILKNIRPKQNLILTRLSGNRVDRTGVFAGMSGSPVYIDNKLVGAIAYSFPFSREPIAGITPIRETVDIFKEKPGIRSIRTSQVNLNELHRITNSDWLQSDFARPENSLALAWPDYPTQTKLQAIATPLNFSGFSGHTINAFSSQLKALGFIPVQGTGNAQAGNYEKSLLEAGSTISVQLARGDMELSASGTVTYIQGRKVYAFGHPFLNIGYTDLPLNQATVLTVIPSFRTSEKISATTDFVGSIKQDRATGIMGLIGERPTLIPVSMQLRTSRGGIREFSYEVVTDRFLTPLLMALTVHNGIMSSERSVGEQTLRVKTTISMKNQPKVHFENSVSELTNTSLFAALAASAPVKLLFSNTFEDLVMEKINIEISSVEQSRVAILEKIWQDKLEVKAGQEINLTVFIRQSNGTLQIDKYPLKIPEEIEPGPAKLLVSDGSSLGKLDEEAGLGKFAPRDLGQLVKAINNMKKNGRLYVRLYRNQSGAIIAGEGLPNLPPSMLALYNSNKTSGGVQPIDQAIYIEHELGATDLVITGQQEITINIK